MLGWFVQWKLPLLTALAWLELPGDRLPKSTEPLSMTMRWTSRVVVPEDHLFPGRHRDGIGNVRPVAQGAHDRNGHRSWAWGSGSVWLASIRRRRHRRTATWRQLPPVRRRESMKIACCSSSTVTRAADQELANAIPRPTPLAISAMTGLELTGGVRSYADGVRELSGPGRPSRQSIRYFAR